MRKLNILVVGGGIAGMSAAMALRRAGHAIHLIDLDPQWRVYGAGITITGPTLRALQALGVLEEVRRHAYTGSGIRVCDTQGRAIVHIDTPVVGGSDVPGSGGIMRPVLHQILSSHTRAAGVIVELGRTIESLLEDVEGVEVVFDHGQRARYDLVIGADGVFSRVRRLLLPSAPPPTYTGQGAWRVTVPRPPEIDCRHFFLGGPVKLGLSPVSRDEMYMFVLERSDTRLRREGDLHRPLCALIEDYGGVIARVRSQLDARSAIVFRPLEGFLLPAPWHTTIARTLLIGDAAHPTTPQLASGAGMAVEDALVLAEELGRSGWDVPHALHAFMARRWERCRLVVENSLELGRLEQRGAPVEQQTALVQQSLRVLSEPI